MAKVTITFEDVGGNVRAVVEPSFETLMKKHASGHQLSSAEAYALYAARAVREEAKRQGSTRIMIPRIGRA